MTLKHQLNLVHREWRQSRNSRFSVTHLCWGDSTSSWSSPPGRAARNKPHSAVSNTLSDLVWYCSSVWMCELLWVKFIFYRFLCKLISIDLACECQSELQFLLCVFSVLLPTTNIESGVFAMTQTFTSCYEHVGHITKNLITIIYLKFQS